MSRTGCIGWVALALLYLQSPWWVYACLVVLAVLLAVQERLSKSDPVAARVLLSAIIVTPGFFSTWYLLDRKSEFVPFTGAATVALLYLFVINPLLVAHRKAVARCKHGVVGALRDASKCTRCQLEAMYAQEEAEAQARERQLAEDQERQRREAERQRAYEQFKAQVRLPEYLRQMNPEKFELLVCGVYAQLGYAVQHTPYTGDGGVDGILEKDGVRCVLQCKRVKGSVGRPILQQLYGAMGDHSATRAIVVTTGNVSKQAKAFAHRKPIDIVELDQLRILVDQAYAEREIVPPDFQAEGMGFPGEVDTCPTCGRPLRTVRGRRGPFIGCTGYPACRYTRPK